MNKIRIRSRIILGGILGFSTLLLCSTSYSNKNNEVLPKYEERRLEIPGGTLKYQVPKEFTKRLDLQKPILETLREEDLRSRTRMLKTHKEYNRGSTGPIGKGYKACFLRLGSKPRLALGVHFETIESFSERLSMSIGSRDTETPPISTIGSLYQSAPQLPHFSYSFIDNGDNKILKAEPKEKRNLTARISPDSDDSPKRTAYYYSKLNKDTYLEIGYEGDIDQTKTEDLIKGIINSAVIEDNKLPESEISLYFLTENYSYPTGRGSKYAPGEVIRIMDSPEEFLGRYFLKNSVRRVRKEEENEKRKTVNTYQKINESGLELDNEILAIHYSGSAHIYNIERVELLPIGNDFRPEVDRIVRHPYKVILPGDRGLTRAIEVKDSIPLATEPNPITKNTSRVFSEGVDRPKDPY